ncbi:MAG TPA: DUF3386 family protein [Gemmatales bacterium]|nr:DUF3386 family protein [Gemmatales bacterium]HMP60969.1 DUF3386 family protein [Gemmatales bacterium]
MRRCLLSLALLALLPLAAQAHFVWLIPTGPNEAKLIFSDSLDPDDPKLLDRIQHARIFGHDAKGSHHDLKMERAADGFVVKIPEGVNIVCGSCVYGVFQREGQPPILLTYNVLLHRGEGEMPCWDCMKLQVRREKADEFIVQHEAMPVADATVTIIGPEGFKRQTVKTDAEGRFRFSPTGPSGTYGLRVLHATKEPGAHEGKKYEEARTYTTFVFATTTATDAAAEPTPDPEATRLLANARAARATWANFPGFKANIEVNINGRKFQGTVDVDARGKVTLVDLDPTAMAWAKRVLTSAVSHRLGDNTPTETPCSFADTDVDHPLGRLVNVLNDEMHSSYRIKDRQIMMVNRTMGDSRFSILMMENFQNEEGKVLPANYVVQSWHPQTGALVKSEAHRQTFQRLEGYDLPATITVITTDPEVKVNVLKLSDVRLHSRGN